MVNKMTEISKDHNYARGRKAWHEGKTYCEVSLSASYYSIKQKHLMLAGWHDADIKAGIYF